MEERIGIGYDIHRLTEGRKLILGGIEIPYIKGLLGHSDGDALLHAVCDALLGALGEGDIGDRFPDSDPKYHGIASSLLLKEVVARVEQKGFSLVNLDTIVIAQEPSLAPFKKRIKQSIAGILGIEEPRVNIKAKTNENLGEIGKNEAIACWASVIIGPKGGK